MTSERGNTRRAADSADRLMTAIARFTTIIATDWLSFTSGSQVNVRLRNIENPPNFSTA